MSRRNRLTSPNRSNRSYKRRNLAVQRRPRPMAPEEGPGVVAGSTLDRGRGEGRHGPGQYRLICTVRSQIGLPNWSVGGDGGLQLVDRVQQSRHRGL